MSQNMSDLESKEKSEIEELEESSANKPSPLDCSIGKTGPESYWIYSMN